MRYSDPAKRRRAALVRLVAQSMFVSPGIAEEWVDDQSGSTYEREVNGFTVTFNPVARTVTYGPVPVEVDPHRVLPCGCYADSPRGHTCASRGSWDAVRKGL